MTYQEYISSPSWKAKRDERLALDDYRCRLCDEDGTRYRLEVHHRPNSYKKIPSESVADDLITVCARCHILITSAIRQDRYGQHDLPKLNYVTKQDKDNKSHVEYREVSIEFIRPANHAQRANSRSNKQMGAGDQVDFVKARQNGRGL